MGFKWAKSTKINKVSIPLTFDLIKTIVPCDDNERTTGKIASARQPPYLISTVAIHEPFATHNQWTSLSDLGVSQKARKSLSPSS